MSVRTHVEPDCTKIADPVIDLEIEAREKDLGGGFVVRRLLPAAARRMIGPFIFFDHMGPVVMEPGDGLDVRPHPHINLATVTYTFEGEILHRDSLGNEQVIRPGELNWMTAGRGIVHSERSPEHLRKSGARVHGLQLWVALPRALEEIEPSFQHFDADAIPTVETDGARLRIVAGSAYGARSPVNVASPLFYVEAVFSGAGELAVTDEHRERAAYVVAGEVECDQKTFHSGSMIVFRGSAEARLSARTPAHVMLLGGAPLDGERHVFWNFVSSSKERIERAKDDWREGRFPKVPGDDVEFIPLPE